jgi:hypothetical protein
MSSTTINKSMIHSFREQVSDVAVGRADLRDVEKAIRKELRRAKARLNTLQVMELRLVLGGLLFWGPTPVRAKKQYQAVLRMQPDSGEAMMGMADICDKYPDKRYWLESARNAFEKQGNLEGQLDALDGMICSAAIQSIAPDDISSVFARMRKILDNAPDIMANQTGGSKCLLSEGRGREAVDYLEHLLQHALKNERNYSALLFLILPLVAAYSQSGMTFKEARERIGEFRESCSGDNAKHNLDRAAEKAYSSHGLERFGVKREWLEE